MVRIDSRWLARFAALFALGLGGSACATQSATQKHDAAHPATLASAAAACDRIQRQQSIPVGCTTREIEGVPSMFIAFDQQATADRHLSRVAAEVAAPFCDAANNSNRPASVYVAIQTWAKRYNCELGQWGEWFAFNGNIASFRPGEATTQRPNAQVAIAEAITRCRRVQESTRIPVACKLQYIDETPAMVIGFRNEQEASEFLRPMAEDIAGPFCDAANESGQSASVAVIVGQNSARVFNCERGQWGEWFQLREGDGDESEREARARAGEISL